MIDIILADDHRLFREGLRRLLMADGRFRVVGEAADGEEFLALLAGNTPLASGMRLGSTPLLVFMDIDMPSMGGIEATRRALARWPDLRVVALSMHGEEEFYGPMMAAGAVGFLMKDSTLEQVAAAAFDALGLPPTDTPDVLSTREREGGNGRGEPAASVESGLVGGATEQLSPREREVLPLICTGLSTTQIADRLFISPRTVDKHRASILSKTACPNTASLVVWAVRHGLITV